MDEKPRREFRFEPLNILSDTTANLDTTQDSTNSSIDHIVNTIANMKNYAMFGKITEDQYDQGIEDMITEIDANPIKYKGEDISLKVKDGLSKTKFKQA